MTTGTKNERVFPPSLKKHTRGGKIFPTGMYKFQSPCTAVVALELQTLLEVIDYLRKSTLHKSTFN